MQVRPMVVGVALALWSAGSLLACMWDADTLAMERQRFPLAIELIAGKFIRHSVNFYRWRIDDRLKRIAGDPSPHLYDDLAVAYSKTGDHRRAIETMETKEQKYPGLYTTASNLGTFMLLDGQWKDCVRHIYRAIEIDPNAHFGREIYQALIVEYLLLKQPEDQSVLPMSYPLDDGERDTFAAFIRRELEHEDDKPWRKKLSNQAAIKGVLGMMRFANYDSPILLEALGDLLADPSAEQDQESKLLAVRAYMKASWEVENPKSKAAYRKLSLQLLAKNSDPRSGSVEFQKIEVQLRQEVRNARRWFDAVAADERNWIESGMNPEVEFARKYYQDPKLKAGEKKKRPTAAERGQGFF